MDIGAFFKNSWDRFMANIGMAIGLYLVGSIVGGLLSGLTLGIAGIPVFAGMYKAFRRIQQGGTPDFGDLFSEFSNFGKWFKLWLLMLVVGLISAITFGLGGIVAGFLLYFLFPLMLEKDMDAFAAAKESMSMVTSQFGALFLPILLAMVVSGAGSIVVYIGILFTAPWMMIGSWFIYDFAVGSGGNVEEAAPAE